MRDAERVPENNVGILDSSIAVCDPFGDATRRLAGRLWDVPARWAQLVVGVWPKSQLKVKD
jgi:hypothetical protein